MSLIDVNRLQHFSGFGMSSGADGYLVQPTSDSEIQAILADARNSNRHIVLRGAGRSYGDASELAESIVLDLSRMNRVLGYDSSSGIIEAEAGITIEDIWKLAIVDGWWPPVVSGTMYPTMGGAIAMNIHGKNHYRQGCIAEHISEIEVMNAAGEVFKLQRGDPLFKWIAGSAGLLGVVLRFKLQLKRVHSGDLRVLPISVRNWDEQFETLEAYESSADYMVSWVDCFKPGRGLIHVAWHLIEDAAQPSSLRLDHQNLPDSLLGFIPKSTMWRFLKPFNNRLGMRLINASKYHASKLLGNEKPIHQSLAEFSFLLDYVPNWRNAYLPDGFIQYQCFVPRQSAKTVMRDIVDMQRAAKLEAFLGVLKRHKAEDYPLTYALDGYSLALDFKVRKNRWSDLQKLCYRMNDRVLAAGGKFYFAKDSTLRPEDARRYLGSETVSELQRLKRECDPDGVFSSALAQRLELFRN